MRRRSRRGSKRLGAAKAAARDPDRTELEGMAEEALTDFSIEELREFLEADLVDVPVDPEFKERLRERLWELVKSRAPGRTN